ncbi:hypothetical protein HZB04_03820 [Candidatus Wolfebacteria bacterium]|nr:hypothetical protein [Candidatus Wolfebacteria bacterium]
MRGDTRLRIKKGVAALPIVLLIGGIIVEIAVAGVFIAFFISQSGLGIKLSDEALTAAKSGVQDAIIKIIRNKDFSSSSGYTLAVGSRSATIIVCRDSYTVSMACDTNNVGKDEIISTGSAALKRRKLKAMVNVDSVTGEMKVISIEEAAL